MPKISAVYDPSDTKGWLAIDEAGNSERKERGDATDQAWRYYYGNHPKPLKLEPGQQDHNVLFNFVGQAIDRMAAFVGVPRFEVVGGSEVEPDPAGLLRMEKTAEQIALERFWDVNRLDHLIHDIYLSGFVSGHSFMRLLLPSEAGEPPGIALLDPRYVTVYWDVNDTRRVLFYRLKWAMSENETRCQDIVPDWLVNREAPRTPRSWVIIEYRVKVTWEEIGRDVWEYPFAPIMDWKNAPSPFQYYGRPDVGGSMRLNDAANFVASNLNKIIYHHAGPQTVVTGGRLSDARTGPGTIVEFDSPETKVFNLEMESDLASSMEFLNVLRGAFFQQARVVDTATIKDKLGQLTNFAVRMLYTDQLDAAYQKHEIYGDALAEASRRALALMGINVAQVNAVWDDPLPQSRVETVAAVAQEAQLGMTSRQTLLEDLGRDPVVEDERKDDEQMRQQESVADMLIGLGNRGLLSSGR